MRSTTCPNCQADLPAAARFCPGCGRPGHVAAHSGARRDRYRQVPLNSGARQALRQWLEVRFQVDSDTVLIGRDRQPLRPRGVQRLLDRHARKAGLAEVTPHRLTEVAQLLGHSRLETTRIYTQPGQADLAQAVEAVDWEEG